ncbi:MAG: bifunctional diguanylate cyclase/phosphodiesterase, partial [Acidimicrobiia bacterium]|nr:bifunctional diguanylate cyclase/phosphodiesterase [Acidimicrobiia bacterium]
DDLLAAVGRRLSESVRPFDVVSRIDGDEFAILLRCLDDVEDATAAMTRILNELALPYRLDSRSLEVTTSIGVALPRSPREHPESIIQRAEMAMHRAKSLGRCRIELALQQTDIDLTATTPDLDVRAGIAGDQFRPWYQPIVDLDTGGVVACEALLRWMHPSFGALAAGEFIELATTEGVLVPLANRAIRHALDEAAGHPDLELFVNLSPHQLQGDIGADMLSWCNAAGLAPTRLVVEITESTIVTEPEAAREQLLVLHDAGVRIAIDDFGSGYSSFSRMRLFPISILKIDAALITDIDIDDRCRRLVDGIVKLADGLGVAVVAEGVEADAEVEVLKALGVRLAQGYQFGAAVPTPGATDALTLLS